MNTMMNLSVPGHKTQSCFMMCVIQPGSETQLVVLGVNAPLLLHFMLMMDTCPFAVQVSFLGDVSNLWPALVFPCSVCLQSKCLTV